MSQGRHRKPRRITAPPKPQKTPKDRSPGIVFSTAELVVIILLGTVGVLMVFAARPFTHRGTRG